MSFLHTLGSLPNLKQFSREYKVSFHDFLRKIKPPRLNPEEELFLNMKKHCIIHQKYDKMSKLHELVDGDDTTGNWEKRDEAWFIY